MTGPKAIVVPIFLAAQALLVHWTGGVERPHSRQARFDAFPLRMGSWQRVSEPPVDEATKAQLGADRLMNSMYARQPDGGYVNLFVAWFQSQRAGTSQPHSPQVCLPASRLGRAESNGVIDLATSAGTISVDRYVVSHQEERAVVLYWYQTPRRVVAGEWAAKFWLMSDALRDRRTDTSSVRSNRLGPQLRRSRGNKSRQ